jgi:hypothetical protein
VFRHNRNLGNQDAPWRSADSAETNIAGIVLTVGTGVLEPVLGLAKRRLSARLGSAPTAGKAPEPCCAPTWPPRDVLEQPRGRYQRPT